MKLLSFFLPAAALAVLLFSCGPSRVQSSASAPAAATQPESGYNEALARQLNADSYGMKKYVMAFLKSGPNRNQDSETAAGLQQAHMANISRLAEEGKLILAGPFLDKGEVRGIYIFNVESLEEAARLTETDPAIKAGRLVMELHPWYGSAALQQVNAIHNTLSQTPIDK